MKMSLSTVVIHRWLPAAALCIGILGSVVPGASRAAPVVIGQVAPLTGIKAGDGRGYSAGIQMYFDHVNKAGGINGNTLVLVRKDDAGRADQTVAATRQLLVEHRPVLLTGFMGSSNLSQLQQSGLLDKERIALVGYRGATFVPNSPLMYNVRAELREEIGKITQHLSTVGVTRLGLLYEDGPDAAALLASTQQAIREHGATLVEKASYPAGTMRADGAIRILLAGNPQAILLVASGAAASSFIENYRIEGGTARIFASSEVDLEQMSKRLSEEHMQGVSIAQVTPNPYRVVSRLSKEFREIYAASGDASVPVSYAMMEGYIAAKVIAEAVRRAGGRPTREGLAAALDRMDGFDLGGYLIGYRAGQRSGSRFVELSIISASGRIRQ
ncbi:ABC transporter substrate-binding protein [Paucibacter sp. O1-1]|nr:ABC transporter substrate-binding protein [Paucibacter sp. O1-1]MDA3825089.1 ABC transporter substrate-binding protein [Paucibacter sp. O1-1]